MSWHFYTDHRYNNVDYTLTPEKRARQDKEWFEARLLDAKNLRKSLPLQGELNWMSAAYPPMLAILPKHAISRMGLINEIWVPGGDCEISISDHPFLGIYQDIQISYSDITFRVYRGSTTHNLLLSRRKLTVVPYLWEDSLHLPSLNT